MVKKNIEENSIEYPLEEDGYLNLIGKYITVFSCRYIYYGELIEEGKKYIKLKNPSIVYETGDFSEKKFTDIQLMSTKSFSINKDSVESFGILDKKNDESK